MTNTTTGPLNMPVEDLPACLTFLRMQRECTVFADHADLKAIIGACKRAQKAESTKGVPVTPIDPLACTASAQQIAGQDWIRQL